MDGRRGDALPLDPPQRIRRSGTVKVASEGRHTPARPGSYDARVTVIPNRRKSATVSSGVSASTMIPLTSVSGAMT